MTDFTRTESLEELADESIPIVQEMKPPINKQGWNLIGYGCGLLAIQIFIWFAVSSNSHYSFNNSPTAAVGEFIGRNLFLLASLVFFYKGSKKRGFPPLS